MVINDLLKSISHPAAYSLLQPELEKTYLLDEISVLNGVMRVFHALPLFEYRLNRGLKSKFNELRRETHGEKLNWRIDWHYFFGASATNLTGFSASYSHLFTPLTGTAIRKSDLASAEIAQPLHSLSKAVLNAHEALYHLVGGEIIAADQDPGGTPLDVVFIGKLIGEMSERTGQIVSQATKKNSKSVYACAQIRFPQAVF